MRKKKLSFYSFIVQLHESIINLIDIVFHNYITLVSFFSAGPKIWGGGVHSASIDYTIQSQKIAPLPNTLEYIGIDFQVNLLCIMYVRHPAYHVC